MNLDYQYFIQNNIDIYKELGINRDASNLDIRKAYINKVKETHPDQYMQSDPKKFDELSEKLKIYNKIMNVFNNEVQRKKYDEWYDKNIKVNFNNEKAKDKKEKTNNNDDLKNIRENAKIILNRIGFTKYISEIEKADTKEKINTIIFKAQMEFDKYKDILKQKIKNMNIPENEKEKYEQDINSCADLHSLNKMKEKINSKEKNIIPYNVENGKNNTSNIDKPTNIVPVNNDMMVNKPQPIKVIDQKPSWWSRNWKKVLIAAGIATVAVLAAPYIVQPIMMLNSIAWYHAPAAIQTVLHGINVGLGAIGSASPFASFTYAATAGEWALNGAVFNAAASAGSTLAAVAGISADLGMATGLGVLMKKGYKSVKQGIKAIKARKNETRNKNNKKDEVKQNIDEKINQAKETYNNIREKVKKEKKEKDNNRKIGFINKWKEKYNNYKTKTEIPIPDNDPTINPISQKQELNNNLAAQREWIESLPYSKEIKNNIIKQISKAKTVEEIDNILDNNMFVKAYERKNNKYNEVDRYKLDAINTLAKLNISYDKANSLITNMQKANSKKEVNNIMNDKQVLNLLKKEYCYKIIDENINGKMLTDITKNIAKCNSIDELINCVKQSEKLIKEEKMVNNNERMKGKAA